MAAVRLDSRAPSNSLEAIFSLIREPLPAAMLQPIVSMSRVIGNGCIARSPGTHVGRVAMIMVANKIPRARLIELATSATLAALRISLGASFSA